MTGVRETPGDDELAAARQVVDVFATESLLALDKYSQSIPADATDQARQTADRLATWWRRLKMDDALLGADPTDAEQILMKAADLSLDPENDFGLSLEDAAEQADMQTGLESRPALRKGMADFRREFDEAYGGQAGVPSRADEWLEASLTRLARASLLRDVIAEGSRVQVDQPTRDAADQVVRQGQQFIGGQDRLAADRAAPDARREAVGRQARSMLGLAAYSAGVVMSGAPPLATFAMSAPVGPILLARTVSNWRAYRDAPPPGVDPAQAQLRSVRADLINTLDSSTPPRSTSRPDRHRRPGTPSR
jgi:hypothetical protein